MINLIYFCIQFYLLLEEGLGIVYTVKLIKHRNDRPHGIVRSNDDIFISTLKSLPLQLDDVILL